MKILKTISLLLTIILITNSCSDLPRIIKLTWGDIEFVNESTLIVTDTIVDINADITEFGHIWSEINPDVKLETHEGKQPYFDSPSNNGFSSTIKELEEGKHITSELMQKIEENHLLMVMFVLFHHLLFL